MSNPRIAQCRQCGIEFQLKRPDRPTACSRKCGQLLRQCQPLSERFWSKVQKSEGCWLWQASLNTSGYGHILVANGTIRPAHQVAWFLETGDWPDLCVCHHCDTPRCVRFAHLFLGSHAENMRDMTRKGRNPHARLTEIQVRQIRAALAAGATPKQVASEMSLNPESVRNIGRGKRWAWLAH